MERYKRYTKLKGIGYFILSILLILVGIASLIVGIRTSNNDYDWTWFWCLVFSLPLFYSSYILIKVGSKEIYLNGQGRWVTTAEYTTQSSSYNRSEEPSADDDSDECSISIGRDLSREEQYAAYQNYHRRMGR